MSAQREDELDNPIKCWLGCPVMEKIELMGVHVRKKCTFRNVECDLCRNIFKEVDIYRHKLRDCPQRLVGCPNAWIGCKEMQTYENHEKHARMRCAYRKAECRKGCGRYVPYCKRDDHETVLTPSLPPSLTHSLTHSLLLPGTLQVQTDCM